jgi:hypothetical protein
MGARAAFVAMQRRSKHASSTVEAVFSVWSLPRSYHEDNRRYKELSVQLWSINQRATEAEESALLRFVTRKLLVKTSQRNSPCGELLPRLVKLD